MDSPIPKSGPSFSGTPTNACRTCFGGWVCNEHQAQRIFKGKVVNKAHTINTGVDEFPRYVLEYLIDNYCTRGELQRGHEQGRPPAARRTSSTGLRPRRSATTSARTATTHLSPTWKSGWSRPKTSIGRTISAINESFVNIPESIVRQYPMLLSGGMWGTIDLTYDETEVHNKKIRPFKVTAFTPFQVSVINLDEFIEKRKEFSDRRMDRYPDQLLRPEPGA